MDRLHSAPWRGRRGRVHQQAHSHRQLARLINVAQKFGPGINALTTGKTSSQVKCSSMFTFIMMEKLQSMSAKDRISVDGTTTLVE
jgi:hypothetical protein